MTSPVTRQDMASARAEERNFKLLIYITKEDDSSPVFFKVDGERFKETRTLKLQIDTTYKVVLEIRPPMDLSEASIAGGAIEPKLAKNDESVRSYECSWSTHGMQESKSKDRSYLALALKFADNRQLNAQIQSKMYHTKNKNHLKWGSCLKTLELSCKFQDGQNFVDVQQVVFK